MKKIMFLAITFLLAATINAQTTAGRKAGKGQQEYLKIEPPVKKSAEKKKKVDQKKPARKTVLGGKTSIPYKGICSMPACAGDKRRPTELA